MKKDFLHGNGAYLAAVCMVAIVAVVIMVFTGVSNSRMAGFAGNAIWGIESVKTDPFSDTKTIYSEEKEEEGDFPDDPRYGEESITAGVMTTYHNTGVYLATCIDSDNGRNLPTRGTTTDGPVSVTDYCNVTINPQSNPDILVEFTCSQYQGNYQSGTHIMRNEVNCRTAGYDTCYQGECVYLSSSGTPQVGQVGDDGLIERSGTGFTTTYK